MQFRMCNKSKKKISTCWALPPLRKSVERCFLRKKISFIDPSPQHTCNPKTTLSSSPPSRLPFRNDQRPPRRLHPRAPSPRRAKKDAVRSRAPPRKQWQMRTDSPVVLLLFVRAVPGIRNGSARWRPCWGSWHNRTDALLIFPNPRRGSTELEPVRMEDTGWSWKQSLKLSCIS